MIKTGTARRDVWRVCVGAVLGILFIVMIAMAAPPASDDVRGNEPLSRTQFYAIVSEAVDLAARPHKSDGNPADFPAHWRTLDRDKLARLLRMPEFPRLSQPAKESLLDQAGEWGLMHFKTPSDAAALWNRWLPRITGEEHEQPNERSRQAFVWTSGARWANEAFAMLTLFNCLPSSATRNIAEEPMFWAMENGKGWQSGNGDDFAACVREDAVRNSGYDYRTYRYNATTPRSIAVAAILERSFVNTLMAKGCDGTGIDRCLPLFEALHSLDPHSAALPKLLKKMEPAFRLDEAVVVPARFQPSTDSDMRRESWDKLSDAERLQIRDVQRLALQKVFFLTEKLPVLLARPRAWPAGELDRTLAVLMRLTLTLQDAERVNEWRTPLSLGSSRRFADPWATLQSPHGLTRAARASLERLGAQYASGNACGWARHGLGNGLDGVPRAFWIGFARSEINATHATCDELNNLTSSLYEEAAKSNRAGQARRILEPLAGLRAQIGKGGSIPDTLIVALGRSCNVEGKHLPHDPWKICAAIAKKATDAAALEAAANPVDPNACPDDLAMNVALASGYSDDQDSWNGQYSACRRMTSDRSRSIVSFSTPHADSATDSVGGGEGGSADSYDLDTFVVRTDRAAVLAHLHEANAIESDGVRFEGLQIDPARYRLSASRQTFGVLVAHGIASHAITYSETTLNLYVQRGHRLRKVVSGLNIERIADSDDSACPNVLMRTASSLHVGKHSHHGYADIIVTQTAALVDRESAAPTCADDDTIAPVVYTMRYDGHRYVVPAQLAE